MSKKFFAVVYFILTFWAIPQAQKVLTKSYALVIGVSKYEDPKITSLKHADKDAKAFADFCASPSGLNISTDRLRILIDEKASYWNIIDGLDWLKKNAQRDDQIYIYFAGHVRHGKQRVEIWISIGSRLPTYELSGQVFVFGLT